MDDDIPEDRKPRVSTDDMFDRGVANALARNIDRRDPLPTDERIRYIAREEARNLLGAIGFDVSDVKAQAATAAEVAQIRAVNQSIGSVVKRVFMWLVGLILAGLAAIGLFFSGHWK